MHVSSIFTKTINKPVADKYYAMLQFEFHETNSDDLNKNAICKFQTSQKNFSKIHVVKIDVQKNMWLKTVLINPMFLYGIKQKEQCLCQLWIYEYIGINNGTVFFFRIFKKCDISLHTTNDNELG